VEPTELRSEILGQAGGDPCLLRRWPLRSDPQGARGRRPSASVGCSP
jgi:hypothetical protein